MKKPHLVYLGLSGFPHGLAPIQRQKLISKSMINQNWNVSIICNRGVHPVNSNITRSGIVDGIYYEYCFNSTKVGNFLLRNLIKIFAPLGEFLILLKLKREKGISAAIITDRNLIWDAFKYRLFSILLDFRIFLNLVEFYKERPELSLPIRINDFIFNKIGCYFFDGIIPISSFLLREANKYNKRTLLVPIVTDTGAIQEIQLSKRNHVLYCGSASYFNAIKIVLQAFSLLKNDEVKLILVIGGSSSQIANVRKEISALRIHGSVEIKRNIPDDELYALYSSAKALLLPLFDSIQDNARFPHKFGEYLASGTVIITNRIGDIRNYLTHMKNVIYLDSNEPQEMANKIQWVLANDSEAIEIGSNGRNIAKTFFDFRVYGEQLEDFFLMQLKDPGKRK